MSTMNQEDAEEQSVDVKQKMAWLAGAFKKNEATEGKAATPKASSSLIADRMKWLENEKSKQQKPDISTSDVVRKRSSALVQDRQKWLDEQKNKSATAEKSRRRQSMCRTT